MLPGRGDILETAPLYIGTGFVVLKRRRRLAMSFFRPTDDALLDGAFGKVHAG
jgi:hypothetical protein